MSDARLNFRASRFTLLRRSTSTRRYFLGLGSKVSLSFHALPVLDLKILPNSSSACSAVPNGVFWYCPLR